MLHGLDFGLDHTGRMRGIDEVEQGLACDCECPECGSPLVARKGAVRVHHFAHRGASCATGAESALHRMAKQIVAVGFEGLPDIYQQPRHQLDFVIAKEFGKHFELKFSAANLLNSPFTRTQGEDDTGDNVMDEYTKGMDFSIGAGYTY